MGWACYPSGREPLPCDGHTHAIIMNHCEKEGNLIIKQTQYTVVVQSAFQMAYNINKSLHANMPTIKLLTC